MRYTDDPDKRRESLLLVEDSQSTAALISDSLLETSGQLAVTVATTIAEARAWLDYNTPDLAIVDLNLPDGKGTVLLPIDQNSAHFPIIIMTAAGSEMEAVEAIKAGAVDYLVKTPEVIGSLPMIVDRALRQWDYILKQRLTEDALRESEERFRSIFQTTAAGMVVISLFKNILQVNPAFCAFTGYSEEELLNMSILDITLQDDHGKISGIYDDLFSLASKSVDCERRYLRKDGTIVWGHVSIACILGGDGLPAYAIGLVQDISLRKALEEQLLQANRELDAFVHTVSHDLRSPLTPVIGYVQFIQDEYAAELPPAVNEILAEVLSQGVRMHMMLEDLLALATVGKVEPPALPVCGDEVLKEVLLRFSSGQPSEHEVIVPASLPDLLIPKTLYLQILDNLVGNALHYAAGKPVEVYSERKGSVARLLVRDHGPGVPDEEKKKIFELFSRGSTGRKISGTGIGLAIVQKIARLHKGSVWVEDAPGGGSIFIVEMKDV